MIEDIFDGKFGGVTTFCWMQDGLYAVASIGSLYGERDWAFRKRSRARLNNRGVRNFQDRWTTERQVTHGGLAYGIPRNLLTPPARTPVALAKSRVAIGGAA